MPKCKSCGQDMAEHVNFCPNCGASSKTGKESMDEESIYTDEEVQIIAEKVAEQLREMPDFLMPIFFKYECEKGPLGICSSYSTPYNPLGKFPVEADALTTKQKAMVTKIVGKAKSQVGKDYKEVKIHRKFMKEFMPLKNGMSRSELADAKEQGRMDTIFRAIKK